MLNPLDSWCGTCPSPISGNPPAWQERAVMLIRPEIIRASAQGRKKRFAPVLALWHHPCYILVSLRRCGGSVQRSRRVDKKVTFPVGDLVLEGRMWTSTSGKDVGMVLCHPHPLHGGNMYSNVVSVVAQALWQRDVTTLRFNFRGTLGREAEVAEA